MSADDTLTLDRLDAEGASTGTVALDPAIFGAPVNVAAMHQVVVAQLAAARRGTSKVKTRGEVAGGGKKPWRQKGTGRARQGSSRAPQWSGGGIVGGPTGEQNHRKRTNKKLRQVALRSALSDRAGNGDVRVIDDFGFDAPRTKDALALLGALELGARHVLVVLPGRHDAAWRSFRNLRAVHVLTVDQLNTYDVLVSDVVLFHADALELIGTGRRAEARAAGTDADIDADADPDAAADPDDHDDGDADVDEREEDA